MNRIVNSEQKNFILEQLFNNVTESIIITDVTGTIIIVNPSTERFFGYKHDELIGKKVEVLIPERFANRHVEQRKTYQHSPHSRAMGIGMDLYARRKDNSEFPVEVSLSTFSKEEEKFIVVFLIDITKRKIVEQEVIDQRNKLEVLAHELKASKEKLEVKVQDRTKVLQEALTEIEKSRAELTEALEKEKELNELKSRFLSMASHEFRTPLTTILSSASLIPEYGQTDQQSKRVRHVDKIKSAVNNLNNILGDFLSLSKIEEGKVYADFHKFNMSKVIEEVHSEIKGLCKPGQEIITQYEGPEEIELDSKLIRNVLINLLSNAIKFSDDGKKVYLKTLVKPNRIVIEVKDEGIGISKEDQVHLFERFFRGQNASNIAGTGLGLNIVSKYVELMNGFMEVESEIEKGTTFTLSFPNKKYTP